ncbi:MAG: DNA-protecting protein DprA [Acetobacteraceae bacterium]|nr:DNA-protecting protein DprA [Acetobacteraceae bacterium]
MVRKLNPDQAASSDAVDRLRLARTEGVGPVAYRRLLARYGTAAAALAAVPSLARAGGRQSPPTIVSPEEAESELRGTARLGGRLIFLGDPDYPPLLALLDDAPPAIAVLGDPAALAAHAVALVGGRNASANGQRIAESLAAELARSLVVVSGLARGIDAAAHLGALQSGRTVAAVAGGLDTPYPPEHASLQHRVAEQGAVITEAPLGTVPQARHFPRRNRIIAGLALGVVVVEAALRSGSLITARLAQEAGRELFAVPGSPLDPRSRGANDLIRQGAHITETAQDVLENLPDHPGREGLARLPMFSRGPAPGVAESSVSWKEPPEPVAELVKARMQVLDLLGSSPTAVDDVIRRCQFSAAAVMAILLELELAGQLETLPGSRVALLPQGDS